MRLLGESIAIFIISSCLISLAAMLISSCQSDYKIEHYKFVKHHFEYNNHMYIEFYNGKYGGGVVHDPDCPCRRKDNG